jgi:hypothetical protein
VRSTSSDPPDWEDAAALHDFLVEDAARLEVEAHLTTLPAREATAGARG